MLFQLIHKIHRRLTKLDDVVVLSFPKAGRTWLRVMMDKARVYVHYSHAGADHRHRKHMDELTISESKYANRRVLLMVRDPRDTAISGFFQAKNRLGCFDGDIAKFIRDPHHGIEKIIRFNLMWASASNKVGALSLVHYEDLHSDTASELARAAKFLTGKTLSRRTIDQAIKFGSFDNMRALETSKEGIKLYGNALAPTNLDDPNSFKTRRGEVGGWHEHFSADDIEYAESLFTQYDYFKLIKEASDKLRVHA